MADSNKKETTTTKKVLKFVFLPGFDQSIKQMSFLKPILMRVLGGVFERAGLIRANHPVLTYGADDSVDVSFFDVMAEAWTTLRYGERNPYQIGIYSSVCLMMAAVMTTLFAALMGISTTLFSVASAQLFDHPDSNMDTGGLAVPAPLDPAVGPFNAQIEQYTAEGRTDWGIVILDKLFREGIEGKGGNLQNAFGSLMEVFNSAILVIAGIMLLWVIITIIVDTAKTGQIGGGRHNLVWAPIRIIIALGLLVPLGSTGFSAGQLAVIKAAEWGSNLGTRAWHTYVQNAVTQPLITGTNVKNFSNIVDNLNRVWMCRVSYNAALKETNSYNSKTQIDVFPNIDEIKYDPSLKSYKYKFTVGNRSGDVCGVVTFPGKYKPKTYGPFATDLGVPEAEKTYIMSVRSSYILPIVSNALGYSGVFSFDAIKNGFDFEIGSLSAASRDFACAMSNMALSEDSITATDECDSVPICGQVPEDGTLPDESCYIIAYNAYSSAISSGLNSAVNSMATGSTIVDEALKYGWPSMGWWYHDLYKLNTMVFSAGTSPITVTYEGVSGSAVANVANDVNKYYDKWWQKMTETSVQMSGISDTTFNTPDTSSLEPFAENARVKMDQAETSGNEADLSGAFSGVKKPSLLDFAGGVDGVLRGVSTTAGAMANVVHGIVLWPIKKMTEKILAALGSDAYPVAKIMAVSHEMMSTGREVYNLQAALLYIGALLTILGGWIMAIDLTGFYNLAQALVEGTVGDVVRFSATALVGSSVTGLYYLPFVPFIKVAFAILTWILAIFEAVIMVPVYAVTYINSTANGLEMKEFMGIIWNMLFRPIAIVIGFVGSILVLNTFAIFWNFGFVKTITITSNIIIADGPIEVAMKAAAIAIMYGVGIYSAINTSFKLVEVLPSKVAGQMGWDGSVKGDDSAIGGAVGKVGSIGAQSMDKVRAPRIKRADKPDVPEGAAPGVEGGGTGGDDGGSAPHISPDTGGGAGGGATGGAGGTGAGGTGAGGSAPASGGSGSGSAPVTAGGAPAGVRNYNYQDDSYDTGTYAGMSYRDAQNKYKADMAKYHRTRNPKGADKRKMLMSFVRGVKDIDFN